MRWESQSVARAAAGQPAEGAALPGLGRLTGLVRTVQTPEFAGITFHEVLAKSALNKVPGGSTMPFGWTINPYRGCTHACVYCFARNTHAYLDLDTGHDFDTPDRGQDQRRRGAGTELRGAVAGSASRSRWAPTPTPTSGPRAATG